MHTKCMIFYGNLCYGFDTDSEHLHILRQPTLPAFTQLKPFPFLLNRQLRSLKTSVKEVYIFLEYL